MHEAALLDSSGFFVSVALFSEVGISTATAVVVVVIITIEVKVAFVAYQSDDNLSCPGRG